MNHTSLEIFRVVAEELSIINAAKRLGRVQSNITTRIQQLEQELDAPLFIREGKKISLSPQGKQFLVYTNKLLSLGEEARQSLHPQKPSGTLCLGSMECTAASRLVEPLAAFSLAYPEVALHLSTAPTQQLISKVQQSELDCALVALPPKEDKGVDCPDNLDYQPVFNEQLVWVLPARLNQVSGIEEASSETLAAFTRGCTYREIALNTLNAASDPRVDRATQEVSSYHTMLACVASGTAICLLPVSVLKGLQQPEGLKTLQVCSVTTQLIWRKGSASPAVESLRQALMAAASRQP